MKCYQMDCNNVATHMVYWPNVTPVPACKEHVGAAERIAASLRFTVRIEEIPDDDQRTDKTTE